MSLKNYITQKQITVSAIAKKSGIPYTTVSELVNGKTDIDKVQIGTGMKIARACSLDFPDFYKLCKESTCLPAIPNGDILIKNKSYYLRYSLPGASGEVYLCKVNAANSYFIRDIAEWEIKDIERNIRNQKEIDEVQAWTIDTI